jgi:hypothetical protein
MMMVMRLHVDLAALTALDDGAVRVAVRNIDEELRLASAAPVCLVAAAFSHGAPGRMLKDRRAGDFLGVDDDHVELRHRNSFFFLRHAIARSILILIFTAAPGGPIRRK